MNEIKPLSIRETELKEEMKSRCLNKGLYIDEKAEEKFKMLCHLEDFEVKYHELEHNWNELKKWLEEEIKSWEEAINEERDYELVIEFASRCNTFEETLNKIRELEDGGNDE